MQVSIDSENETVKCIFCENTVLRKFARYSKEYNAYACCICLYH